MNGIELRPLSLGELLDRAFLLYRQNFWLVAGIMAIPSALMIPARFLFMRSRGTRFPWSNPVPQPFHGAYFVVLVLLSFLLFGIAQGAITYAAADTYLGRDSTVRDAYRKLIGRFWRFMGLTLSVGFRVWGIALLALLPLLVVAVILMDIGPKGTLAANHAAVTAFVAAIVVAFILLLVWASLRYAVSLPLVLLEDLTSSAAIRRSVQLTRGRRAQLFVASLLGILVSYATATVVQAPFYAGIAVAQIKGNLPDWLVLIMTVASSLGGAVASPVLMIIVVLFYFDLRIRKEGFDLQHMMSSLPPNPADSAAPASA